MERNKIYGIDIENSFSVEPDVCMCVNMSDLCDDECFRREIMAILEEESFAGGKREREKEEEDENPKRKKDTPDDDTFDMIAQILKDRGYIEKHDVDRLVQLSQSRKNALLAKHKASLYLRYSAAKIIHGDGVNSQHFQALSGVLDPTVIKSCVRMRLGSMFPLRPEREFLDKRQNSSTRKNGKYAPFLFHMNHGITSRGLEGVCSFPDNLRSLDASLEMGGINLRYLPPSIEELRCVRLLSSVNTYDDRVWPTSPDHYEEAFRKVADINKDHKEMLDMATNYSSDHRVYGNPRPFWEEILKSEEIPYAPDSYQIPTLVSDKHFNAMNMPATESKILSLPALKQVEVDMFDSSALNSLPSLRILSVTTFPLKCRRSAALFLPSLTMLVPHCFNCKIHSLGAHYHTNCGCPFDRFVKSVCIPLMLSHDRHIEKLYLPVYMTLVNDTIDTYSLRALSFGCSHALLEISPDLVVKFADNCTKMIRIAQRCQVLEYLAVKYWHDFSWMLTLKHNPAYLCIHGRMTESHLDLGLGSGTPWPGVRTLCATGNMHVLPLLVDRYARENKEGRELRMRCVKYWWEEDVPPFISPECMNWVRMEHAPFITRMVLGSSSCTFVYDLKPVVNLEQLVVKNYAFCRLPEKIVKLYAPGHYLCIPANLHHILVPRQTFTPVWNYSQDDFATVWRMLYEKNPNSSGTRIESFEGHKKMTYLTVHRIVQPFNWLPVSQKWMDLMFPVLKHLFMPDVFKSQMHYRSGNGHGGNLLTGNSGYMTAVEPAALGMHLLPVSTQEDFEEVCDRFPEYADFMGEKWPWDDYDDIYKVHQDRHVAINRLKMWYQNKGVAKRDFSADMGRFKIVIPSSVTRAEIYSVYPIYVRARGSHLENIKIWTPCLSFNVEMDEKIVAPKIDVLGPRQWMRSRKNITEDILLQEDPIYEDYHVRWHGGLVQDTFGMVGTHTNPRTATTYMQDYLQTFNSLDPTDVELKESEQNGLAFPMDPISEYHRALRKTCIQNVNSLDQKRGHPWGLGVVKNMLYLEKCPTEQSKRSITILRKENDKISISFDERTDAYRFSQGKTDHGDRDEFDYVHQWGYVCERLVDEDYYEDFYQSNKASTMY
jgi:hypothetical protein